MEKMLYKSNSVQATKDFAASFAKSLKPGDILCMYGDLGAGKTAFVQGLAVGLGVSDYVNSPTFTIVNEYEGALPLYHFDVYRIGDASEMFDIGFDEYLDGDGVTVIEWAELIEDILPEKRYNVTILKADDENLREIKIEVF